MRIETTARIVRNGIIGGGILTVIVLGILKYKPEAAESLPSVTVGVDFEGSTHPLKSSSE